MGVTANSSEIIQFRQQQQQLVPDKRKGFVQASREWLHERNTDPRLKDRHKVFCACIFNYFNYENYENTNELKAWPSWQIFKAELGWSGSKILQVSNDVEATGALEIERSYNKQTKKKT
jgi:hypothetical protein